jgi:hypothetical protein
MPHRLLSHAYSACKRTGANVSRPVEMPLRRGWAQLLVLNVLVRIAWWCWNLAERLR